MTDLPPELSVGPGLRDYLDAELDRAEVDFTRLPRPVRRRARGGALLTPLLAAAVVLLVAAIAGSQLLGRTSTGPAAVQLGADGLPTMVDGQPVLLLGDVFPPAASGGSFLVGGTLTLTSDPCPDLSGPSPAPCDESWHLMDAAGTTGIGLADVTGAPGFVRTTGAPTVVRVGAAPPCGGCAGSYEVEAVVWRKPTKGPMPDNASPPQGGPIYGSLVPDFIPALTRDGTTIAGYVPKKYLIGPLDALPGTPSNPPQQPPEPVYAEDLTTLVGHMVPGVGFVPLGASPAPAAPSVLSVCGAYLLPNGNCVGIPGPEDSGATCAPQPVGPCSWVWKSPYPTH